MPEEIEPLLHRRTDLSTFLVHLTREYDTSASRDNLISILTDRRIEARSVYGMASKWSEKDQAVAATQRCVCLSEAPLEQTWMLVRDIKGRSTRLSSYGLVFTKSFGRRRGANPVWYLDITPGHDWLTNPVNALVEIARRGESFRIKSTPPSVAGPLEKSPAPADDPILQLTPFLEQMGPTNQQGQIKEFWWEREWRVVGDLAFHWNNVVAVLVPESDHDDLVTDLAAQLGQDESFVDSRLHFLDPQWGLERMIAALAGVPENEAGPLIRP